MNNKSKLFRNGSYSAVLTVIVIAIVVVINVAVNYLPSNWTRIDLSQEQLFSMSEQTKEVVGGLNEDVTVYFVTQEGSEDDVLEEMLNQYRALSSHLKVQKVDTAVNPTFTSGYTTDGLVDNSLIVESAKRFQVIPNDQIYVTGTAVNTSNSQTMETHEFEGEQRLTSAVDYVVSDDLPKIYTITGHRETDLSESFLTEISGQNIETENLSLVTSGKVPEDAKCLVFNAPLKDISKDEADMLTAYVRNGGNLLVISSYMADDLPNLDSVLKLYGMEIQSGIVLEQDSSHMYSNVADTIFPSLHSHEITDPLMDSNMTLLVMTGQNIALDTSLDNVTQGSLLTSSGTAYIRPVEDVLSGAAGSTRKAPGDPSGTMTLAAAAELAIDEDTVSRAVIFGSPYMLEDQVNEMVAGANFDFGINTVGWMCEHESAISIHSKSLDGENLIMTSAQENLWNGILVAGLPIVIIVIGIIVWIIRRRR